MSIAELLAVVVPPTNPNEQGDEMAWEKVQTDLGLRLPSDLRDFGHAYGTGVFCQGHIQVYNPFSKHYGEIVEFELGLLRKQTLFEADPLPYPVFSTPDGLFPWGRDENGCSMAWQTKGKPDEWPILVMDSGNGRELWHLSMTSFLAKSFTNEIAAIIWRDEPFTADQRVFRPK